MSRLMAVAILSLLGLPHCLAESRSLSHVGPYRPLTATETSGAAPSGFEAALVEAIIEQRPDDLQSTGFRVGTQEDGIEVYRARPSGLVATEGAFDSWASLEGRTACLVANSPYGNQIAERFKVRFRSYPSSAHALIGLKLGECEVVVDDDRLLADIAQLPEWKRYNRVLAPLEDAEVSLRLSSVQPGKDEAIRQAVSDWQRSEADDELVQYWIDEVAFQAYVMADTLDCH